MMLSIPLETLAYIVEKAREFDSEVPGDAEDTESSAADDQEREILLDTPDNPTPVELREAIESLNDDQRNELLALVFLGRGDFEASAWEEALEQAKLSRTTTETGYLMGTPLLADYVEEAINALGISIEDIERERL
jgi:hypothetical protein